jgi:hypothetical protein
MLTTNKYKPATVLVNKCFSIPVRVEVFFFSMASWLETKYLAFYSRYNIILDNINFHDKQI